MAINMKILGIQFGRKPKDNVESADANNQKRSDFQDPLEPIARMHRGDDQKWENTENGYKFKSVEDFPFYSPSIADEGKTTLKGKATDAATISKAVMDNGFKSISSDGAMNSYTVPFLLQDWYMSQSFIGYQACAIIAQNWLVDKACSMVGRDAVRKGWEVKASADKELSKEAAELIVNKDMELRISDHLVEAERFKNIFGIRILLFVVDSPDEDYYEKPFNIDGVRKGSYKGISQVDPYWCMPFMTSQATADPAHQHFYDPEYWVISGKKYHRSHIIVLRNSETADILKPTYLFGGIPLTQQIYERVYAAERTANEAPLLAMSKRTTTIKTDVDKAIANESSFAKRLALWIKYRDNHAVKVLGKGEEIDQFDTNLSDFDSVIMNQYQLVAAIAKVPSTKLLGTSPKGFNATGEFEMVSYHEELETCQKHDLTPILTRHYLIMLRSLGIDCDVKVVWMPVGSLTAQQQADINDKKAQTGKTLIDGGVISPDEERERIRDDRNSGYNRLTDAEAETQPGLSPENMASMGKSAGEIIQGKADIEQAKSDILKQSGAFYEQTGELPPGGERGELAENPAGENPVIPEEAKLDALNDGVNGKHRLLQELHESLEAIQENRMEEGKDVKFDAYENRQSVKPSVSPSVKGSILNLHHQVDKIDVSAMPKMKINGHICLLENPRGSIRRGNSVDGGWQTTMPHHYGFIKGTNGADGDEVDCFIGNNPKSKKIFIINQNDNHSGEFDEHKVMFGFDTAEEAESGYKSAYDSKWNGFGSIHEVDIETFKQWLQGECNEPFGGA